MSEMKDSGIEWIGNIPWNWDKSRIKYVASFHNGDRGKNYPSSEDMVDNGVIFLTSNNIHSIEIDGSIELSKYITREKYLSLGGAKVQHNDLIYCLRGSVGNCAINTIFVEGTIASSLVVIRPIRVSARYLNYVMNSPINQIQTADAMNGTCAANLAAESVANYHFVLPPNEQQNKIVTFLDSICKKLETIITDIKVQQTNLEQYKQSIISEAVTKGFNRQVKTRESGIRWCPNIPVHWKTDRGKFILQLLERPVYEDDGVITCFRDGEVTLRSKRREDGFTVSLQEAGYQGIEPGDLVVHGMDGFAGAIGISDSRGKGTPVLNVMDSQQNKRYLMYYLRWIAKIGVFESLSTGIRVRSCDTNWNKLRELPYIVPPIEEQDAIAKYLDEKCAKIDEAIADKRKLLDILDNYKKSLIFEYVTGKKEVL